MFDLTAYEVLLTSFTYAFILSVINSIYIHRSVCHRMVTYHTVIEKLFRFVLWITIGVPGKNAVAHHILHHRHSDKPGDPQSPIVHGKMYMLVIRPLLFLAKICLFPLVKIKEPYAPNESELNKLVNGRRDIGVEYRYAGLGPVTFLAINFILFSWAGLAVVYLSVCIGIVMFKIGIEAGSHLIGYTNYKLNDNSKNMFPIGILLAGEEFGNNHHAYGSDPKFSRRWFEFDFGWACICALKFLKLASIKQSGHNMESE